MNIKSTFRFLTLTAFAFSCVMLSSMSDNWQVALAKAGYYEQPGKPSGSPGNPSPPGKPGDFPGNPTPPGKSK